MREDAVPQVTQEENRNWQVTNFFFSGSKADVNITLKKLLCDWETKM